MFKNLKARMALAMAFMWAAIVALPGALAAVNTTAIEEMGDTLIALIVALIPILLILVVWKKIGRGMG